MIIGDIETTEKVEYEDLLKNYYEKMEIIEEQDKEIERLNNIINELEKDIDLELYKTRTNDEYNKGLFNAFRYVKNKLQELKGSDKE